MKIFILEKLAEIKRPTRTMGRVKKSIKKFLRLSLRGITKNWLARLRNLKPRKLTKVKKKINSKLLSRLKSNSVSI